MASLWESWMIVEQNRTLVNGCVSKSLRNWTFNHFRDWHSLNYRTFLYLLYWLLQCDIISIIFCCDYRHISWSFAGNFLKIWSEPSILDVNIIYCNDLWAAMHNICPILWFCAFPNECNCGKFIIKHHIKLRWYMTSF